MSQIIDIRRQYSMGDAKMLSYANVMYLNFSQDLADFTAFDPAFDAAYAANLQQTIDDIMSFGADLQLKYATQQCTLDMESKVKECQAYFQSIKFFVKKAFEARPGTWNEFGFNTYLKAAKEPPLMIQFMLELHQAATKYSAQLIAVNFSAPQIAHIATLAQQLQTAISDQEQAKGTRSTASNERVIMLNKLWNILKRIRQAAKIVYSTEAGKWQQYLLP